MSWQWALTPPLLSLQELPGEVPGGEQHVPHLQDCHPPEPPSAVYWVSTNQGLRAELHSQQQTGGLHWKGTAVLGLLWPGCLTAALLCPPMT